MLPNALDLPQRKRNNLIFEKQAHVVSSVSMPN
jgi:hypothetical protein